MIGRKPDVDPAIQQHSCQERCFQCKLAYQSCKRTVRSSRYIVFDRKSMPIVACTERIIAGASPDHLDRGRVGQKHEA